MQLVSTNALSMDYFVFAVVVWWGGWGVVFNLYCPSLNDFFFFSEKHA